MGLDKSLGQPDKERLLAALNHEKGDRVPNWEILVDDRATRHILGLPQVGERITLWSLPPKEAVRLVNATGQDAIICSLTVSGIEDGSILNDADYDQLKLPDPTLARKKMQSWIEAVSGTSVGLFARVSGPLTCTYMTTGPVPIESFMYLLYDNLPLIERMMDDFVDYHIGVLESIADLPFDFFYIGDDVSSTTGPLISPDHLQTLWAPRTARLVKAAKAIGKPIIFHCCGMQAPILPYLLEWGIDAVHPLQPVANDIYAVKAKYGKRLTLVGNIDAAKELSFGSEEEVRQSVREHIDQLADGAYVVCSSHSIIDSVKPENYLAMCDETQKYGVYR